MARVCFTLYKCYFKLSIPLFRFVAVCAYLLLNFLLKKVIKISVYHSFYLIYVRIHVFICRGQTRAVVYMHSMKIFNLNLYIENGKKCLSINEIMKAMYDE